MGKLLIMEQICFAASVLFLFLIFGITLCVCVAGISQVLITTPCSMLTECRRTSLNRWVKSAVCTNEYKYLSTPNIYLGNQSVNV